MLGSACERVLGENPIVVAMEFQRKCLLILSVSVSGACGVDGPRVDFIQSRQRKFLTRCLDGPEIKSQSNSCPCC